MLKTKIVTNSKKLILAMLYSIVAVSFYYFMYQLDVINKMMASWAITYHSLPLILQGIFVLAVGALISVILKDVGAYHVEFETESLTKHPQKGLSIIRTAVLTGVLILGRIAFFNIESAYIYPLLLDITLISGGIYFGKWLVYPSYFLHYKRILCAIYNHPAPLTKPYVKSDNLSENIEKPISSVYEDKYDRTFLVVRLTNHLLDLDKTSAFRRMALCGDFGSGKSSILNMIEESVGEQINKNDKQWIFVHFDAWGRADETPNIQGVLLASIIKQLTRYFETSSVQGLPNNYLAALKDAHHFTKLLVHLASSSPDPIAQLASLNQLIQSNGYRLCVFIEDIDRNIAAIKATNALAPLLNNFKDNDHISFILSLGYSSNSSHIINRVIDYREDMPLVNFDMPLTDLAKALHRQASDENIELFNDSIIFRKLHRANSTYQKLISLIKTPRQFAGIEREVTSKWSTLKGELNFDDLLILSVLKIVQPTAFDFIALHINLLQQGTSSKEELDNLWELQSKEINVDIVVIEAIIKNLFPSWLDPQSNQLKRLQGFDNKVIFNNGDKNYWNVYLCAGRIINEESSDQFIFRDMRKFDDLISVEENIPAFITCMVSDVTYVKFIHKFYQSRIKHFNKNFWERVLIKLQGLQQYIDGPFNLNHQRNEIDTLHNIMNYVCESNDSLEDKEKAITPHVKWALEKRLNYLTVIFYDLNRNLYSNNINRVGPTLITKLFIEIYRTQQDFLMLIDDDPQRLIMLLKILALDPIELVLDTKYEPQNSSCEINRLVHQNILEWISSLSLEMQEECFHAMFLKGIEQKEYLDVTRNSYRTSKADAFDLGVIKLMNDANKDSLHQLYSELTQQQKDDENHWLVKADNAIQKL